jgi:hypothetical protein
MCFPDENQNLFTLFCISGILVLYRVKVMIDCFGKLIFVVTLLSILYMMFRSGHWCVVPLEEYLAYQSPLNISIFLAAASGKF